MKTLKHLAGAVALLLCACSSIKRTGSLDEPLPAPSARGSIGAWNLGDGSCTGAIQTGEGAHFWVTDCTTTFGYGWCEFGLRLERRGPSLFVNESKDWRFKIEDDGTLTETRKGERVGTYARSDIGVCRVRAVK